MSNAATPMDSAILNRLSMEQVLVAPERAQWFDGNMRSMQQHPRMAEIAAENERMGGDDSDDGYWPAADDWRSIYRPYVVKRGVLQIPVMGVLLNRFNWQFGEYATGYQYIERAFFRGLRDPDVKGIAFIVNSPGGEVAGNFELVDKLFAARGTKPVTALVRDHSYSAAYSISSAADEIVMTRTGGVGSIGVVTAHMDYSGMMEQRGVKITFIHAPAGGHKVDGNPYEALPADVKQRIQKRIDRIYGIFVSTVARNRGIAESSVIDTKAGTFEPEEAIEIGLADSVGVFEESLEAFTVGVDENGSGDEDMANPQDTGKKTGGEGGDEAAVNAARAEGEAAGKIAGHAEGMTAQKTRIKSILASDAGKARPKAAMSAAMNTDMSVEDAQAFLGDLPEEKGTTAAPVQDNAAAPAGGKPAAKPAAATNHFEEAMGNSDNPGVGAGGDDQTDENASAQEDGNSLLAAYGSATGKTFGAKK